MKRKIVAVIENHFDPIWRRRFRSDFVKDGVNYVSYQKIEQYYIEENLRLAKEIPGYKFQIENPCVIENYIARFPEKKKVLKRLYAEGVLKTSNTGYTIMDSNMVSPEALIRNYLASDAFFKEYVGETPALANRSDAFGNSAQLPQILKAFGAKYLVEVYYNRVGDEDVWQGLDGSAITVKTHPSLGGGGGWMKFKPCPACKGFGCEKCRGRGIDEESAEKEWHAVSLREGVSEGGVMRVGGEELLPHASTVEQVAALAKEKDVDFTIGHWDYLLEKYADLIDRVERGDLDGLKIHTPDYNPNTTGGYVTHIDIKQDLTETEHLLLAGETLEALRMLNGQEPRSYKEIWKHYLLCSFHDSSSATLVDPAYEEVKELFGEIRAFAEEAYGGESYIFNATSAPFSGIYERDGRVAMVKELAPYSFGTVQFEEPARLVEAAEVKAEALVEVILTGKSDETVEEKGENFFIENEFFRVDADNNGILRVTDKRYGVISETLGETRPFDLLWESDIGSAWATFEPPYRQKLLHERTKLIRKEQGKNLVRLCFRTRTSLRDADVTYPNAFCWSVTLYKGYDRIRYELDTDWHTVAKRLRVCFPLSVQGRDLYGIPGGWLERQPYEPDYDDWNGANGDWPAYRYGGVESATKSVAVFNRGTPSYKILPEGAGKILYVSVLRSPNFPTCLHEPGSYTMMDYNGLLDEGEHHFTLEMAAYGTDFAHSNVTAEAEQFSRPPIGVRGKWEGELPGLKSGIASITHIKPAEDGEGIILRVTEHAGVGGAVILELPRWVKAVFRTDMPERKREPIENGCLTLHPFEIATVRMI